MKNSSSPPRRWQRQHNSEKTYLLASSCSALTASMFHSHWNQPFLLVCPFSSHLDYTSSWKEVFSDFQGNGLLSRPVFTPMVRLTIPLQDNCLSLVSLLICKCHKAWLIFFVLFSIILNLVIPVYC